MRWFETFTVLRRICLAGVASAALLSASIAGASDFVNGDLYLLTHSFPGQGRAVVRIDPVTGVTNPIFADGGLDSHMTYDPYRDRLVAKRTFPVDNLLLLDTDGSATDLPYSWPYNPYLWASAGDGRIYLSAAVGGTTRLGYLDAADQSFDLLDTDGITPFVIPSLVFGEMLYDAGANSLFLSYGGLETVVYKIPLSADGTQVTGPPVIASFDAYPVFEAVQGLSQGPDGTLFIKIDINDNTPGLMLFTIDPVTMVFEPFAYLGGYAIAGDTCGTYNSVYGYAATNDTAHDTVRTFVDSGDVQAGVVLATGTSTAAGSAEPGQLVSIGDTIGNFVPACPGDTDGDGDVDISDLGQVLAQFGMSGAGLAGDVDDDGDVDIGDLGLLLANFGVSCV